MPGSWFDVVLVGTLIAAIAFGVHQGLLRQAVLLLALYISTVLAAQYFGILAGLFMNVFTSTTWEMASVIAFVLLLAAFTIVVTWLIWTGYRETKLPTVVAVDNYGGAMLGAFVGLFAIGIMIMTANFALSMPWPDGGNARQMLQVGVGNSALQAMFSSPMPIIQSALRPWMPAEVPIILTS